jgi:exodeoxyribonuclease-3
MKILSWNVNGMRAVGRAGFFEWLEKESPDIIALQETKCRPDQLEDSYLAPLGYQSFWHCATKPGYSGVAIYSRIEPKDMLQGIGVEEIDSEGRVISADFGDFILVNAYFPNSQREHGRLGYKLEFCDKIFKFVEGFKNTGKGVILCGDYNIAHQEIDLRNPKQNMKNAGFLPEERAWMGEFLSKGWVDTFRHFQKDGGHYSWWSYRPGVREKNIGWRIDYHCINKEFLPALKHAFILPEVFGSDHCPVGIEIEL